MNILSVIGSFIMIFALLSYGIGAISIVRFRFLSRWVLFFLTLGLILDLVAVGFMIAGSNNSPFNPHGVIGYTAILGMSVNVVLLWKEYRIKGIGSLISRKIILFSKYAYLWWLIVYIAGSIMKLFFNEEGI